MRALIISLFMLIHNCIFAQYTILGADAYGQANSLVAVSSVSSVYSNIAGISDLSSGFIGANYFKIMPVDGLQYVGIMGVIKPNFLNIGFNADSFGDINYRESRFGLGFAKKMDKVSIGLKGSYLSTQIKDISSRNTFLGEVGMQIKPSKFYSLGLHVVNFSRATLYTNLETIVVFGGAIYPNPKIQISSQLDYLLNSKPRLRAGMRYEIKPEIALSTGVNPEINTVHFGIDLHIKRYGFFYALGTHPNVGMANHLTFMLKLNE